jgi:hypothetical protein
MGWRNDWLYGLIFDEVARVWTRALKESTSPIMGSPPDYLLVREHGSADWEHVACLPPVLREWTYTGEAFEPRPLSDTDELPPPTRRDAFYSYGIVQYHIRPDRKKVLFTFVLGPLYGRGNVFRVFGQGKRGMLTGDPDSNAWVS